MVKPTIPDKIFGRRWSIPVQEKKILVSVFAYFLTAIDKVLIREGKLGTRLCVGANFRFFQYFLIS